LEIRESALISPILWCRDDLVLDFTTDFRALLEVATMFFEIRKIFFLFIVEDGLVHGLLLVHCVVSEEIGDFKIVSVIREHALQQLGVKVRKLLLVHELGEGVVEKQLGFLYFRAIDILQIV